MAFVLTVVLALIPTFVTGRIAVGSPLFFALLACGAAFVSLGLIDHSELKASGAIRGLWICFLLQSILLAGMLAITRLSGMSVLIAFTLVGQAVACLPPRTAAVFVTLLYAGILGGAFFLGGTKEMLAFGATVLAGFAFVAVFMRIAVREKTARAEAERLSVEVSEANRQLREQANQTEELAATRERNRLAREIHDSLGHALTTIAIQLEAAGALHAADPARAWGAVNKAQGLAHEALADVRRSVGALRTEGLPRPLAERLQELIACEEQLTVSFRLLGTPRLLAPEVEHGLFRTAQEGLTNVRRHAVAKSAMLTLAYGDEGRVIVSIEDDGRGRAVVQSGYGLTGLRERAALLGGILVTANRPAGGFSLRMEVPG